MFNQNIEKELASSKQKSENDIMKHDAVKEVKLLMDSDAAEDMRILRGLGGNHQTIIAQNEFGKKLEVEKLDAGFSGGVYTYEQIKGIAIRYNLRFLSSKLFTGKMDIEVVAKIKSFSKEINMEMNDFALGNKYYILAPEQSFNLTEMIKLTKKQLDPAIFYKIDDNHYKLIHKWGIDFTLLRLISGYKWKGWRNHVLVNTLTALPIATLVLSLMMNSIGMVKHPVGTSIVIAIASIAYGFFSSVYMLDDWEIEKDFFSPTKWNSTNKLKRK